MSNENFPECPVALTIGLIGNKWKLFIVRELLSGVKRFGELRKSVTGISQKVLTDNLRALERDGLVIRTVYAEVPPRVEYKLTNIGKGLSCIFDDMENWGEAYRKELLL